MSAFTVHTTTQDRNNMIGGMHIDVVKESPHEHQQSLLLSRIIVNVEKLNEAIMTLNKNLQEINLANMDTELVSQMFKNYQSNVLFHLEGVYLIL
ncbi:DASH complex subunit dad4 [Kalmusia sp. IMI 367209]|nr:DASH complex subunit dad4 [Kalmusia sp. IMI 367209]